MIASATGATMNPAIDSMDLLNTLAPCIQREVMHFFLLKMENSVEKHIHMMLNQPNDNVASYDHSHADLGMIADSWETCS